MKCPACSAELSIVETSGIVLDVCRNACGGIWFDARELDKCQTLPEPLPESLLRPVRYQNAAIDREKERTCPKCSGDVRMKRLVYEADHQLEIDHCAGCGGIWLDLGELKKLRDDSFKRGERQKTISEFEARIHSAAPGALERAKAVLRLIF